MTASEATVGDSEIRYSRDVLVDVLVYHWATSTSGCGCGWAVLGASHAEHVADVYEESINVRRTDPATGPCFGGGRCASPVCPHSRPR